MKVFNREAALAAFGQEAILTAVVSTYLEEAEGARERLERNLASGDRALLRDTAHWLNGGFSTLHAPSACEAAAALESACDRDAPHAELNSLARALLAEMHRLRGHLQSQGSA